MTLSPEQIIELKAMINSALVRLYATDISMIRRRTHERSIAYRFALYFNDLIPSSTFSADNELTIDTDYNRNGETIKNMIGFNETHGVFPDFIFHHRGFNDKNVLVIEFKGAWNRKQKERADDIRKLIEFSHPERNDYQYGLGAFVDLNTTFENTQITYFINGEQEQ